MKQLYSPNQIIFGTLFGGILAAIYFLTENFNALGKDKLSKNVLTMGLVLTISLLVALLFLPANTPPIAIAVLYLAPTGILVRKYSLTKEEIRNSDEYVFQSSWKTLGMTVAWCAVFLVSFFVLAIIASLTGIIEAA